MSHGVGFSAVRAKCPCCPGAVSAMHTNVAGAPSASTQFVVGELYFAGIAQTESLRRISQDRSRQKRGPPTVRLS